MIAQFPRLTDGKQAQAIVTYEIERNTLLAPDATDHYVMANPKSLKGNMKLYMGASPLYRNGASANQGICHQDRSRPEECMGPRSRDLRLGSPEDQVSEKRSLDRSPCGRSTRGTGDCNQLTSAFVAICRASGIPARTVRVPGHCYPEFYLLDDKGQGCWFPCEVSADRGLWRNPSARADHAEGATITACRRLRVEAEPSWKPTGSFPRAS